MRLNKWGAFALGVAGLFSALSAGAIEVYPVVKEIREDTPRENYITVKSMYSAKTSADANKSSSQIYEFVTLELYHVLNPGDEKEKKVKELSQANPTLVFSPTKLIIPYGEERKVRIMPLRSVEREQVYRLRVRPSYPEQELDKGKVRFAIGYDVLLRYLPSGTHSQGLTLSCHNNQWTLTATGNVRSELSQMVVDGRPYLPNFNVYPEKSRTLTVNKRLAFEMGGRSRVYEKCQQKE